MRSNSGEVPAFITIFFPIWHKWIHSMFSSGKEHREMFVKGRLFENKSFSAPVEPVSNSLRLAVAAWGNTRHTHLAALVSCRTRLNFNASWKQCNKQTGNRVANCHCVHASMGTGRPSLIKQLLISELARCKVALTLCLFWSFNVHFFVYCSSVDTAWETIFRMELSNDPAAPCWVTHRGG